MPDAMAYRVVRLPHLSMRLAVGQVYTRAELEGRCGRNNLERRRKLHRRLEDRAYFQPASLASALSRRGTGVRRKGKLAEALPKWAKRPVVCPEPGSKEELSRRRRIADGIAAGLLERVDAEGGIVRDEDVRSTLRAWGFCRNGQRRNVLPPGQDWVHSDTLGLIRTRDQRTCVTAASRRHPHFTRLLVRWLHDHWPQGLPEEFPFTSISVNKDYAARRHRDRFNAGPSVLKAFGRFRGGELRYWPGDDGRAKDVRTLDKKDSVTLCPKGPPVAFDGNRAHEVRPFRGERYSLVFYTTGKYWDAAAQARRTLEDLGFSFPTRESLFQAMCALPWQGREPQEACTPGLDETSGLDE